MDSLLLGKIHSVKIVDAHLGRKAFINMSRWYTNTQAVATRERLAARQNVNVMYRCPWFWKIKLSTSRSSRG